MKSICVLCSCIVAVLVAADLYGLRVNVTPSMPLGVYRVTDARPRRGDLVMFCPDAPMADFALKRGYLAAGACPYGVRPMLKRLAGVGGDSMLWSAHGVSVNGTPVPNSAPHFADKNGRPLPHALRGGTIPPGKALLLASHPDSFDGRYFGLVPQDPLRKVEPVFFVSH